MSDHRFLAALTRFLVFQGLGTDEETLIEIMCSRNNEELMEIKKFYRESNHLIRSKMYNRNKVGSDGTSASSSQTL